MTPIGSIEAASYTTLFLTHLSLLAKQQVSLLDGKFCVKVTDDAEVHVFRVGEYWRVGVSLNSREDGEYDRYWDYAGTGGVALFQTIACVGEWDGSGDAEPAGWTINGQTKVWKEYPHDS